MKPCSACNVLGASMHVGAFAGKGTMWTHRDWMSVCAMAGDAVFYALKEKANLSFAFWAAEG